MSKKPSKNPYQSPLEAQDDFWDLGDDDLQLEPSDSKDQEERPKTKKKAKKSPSKKAPSLEKPSEDKTSKQDPKPKTPQKAPEEDLELPDKTKIETLEKNEAPEKKKTEAELVRKREGHSHKSEKNDKPLSIIEKLSLLVVITCIIGALGWGISAFLNEAPQGTVIPFEENYPAKGEHVTITSVETWWRKPVRTGENADKGVVLEANLIPCARIKLSDGGSTILRVTFRNGERQLIGDTINLSVENGQFTRNDSDEIEIFSTDGFKSSSEINSYANEDIDPWSISITEGETGGESEPLIKARISATSSAK